MAVQHHQAGRLPQAETLYRQVLGADPNHAEALHLLGVIARQVGQPDRAVELIGRAIALAPANAAAHYNLGNALQDQGQLDAASGAFRQAVALNPTMAEAWSNLGQTLTAKGEWDAAVAACRQAVALNPSLAAARNNLGIALNQQGDIDAAGCAFRQAIALQGNYAEAHANLGVALKAQGRLDEAVGALRHALALNPSLAGAHSNLGVCLKDQGQLDAALAACQRALALAPGRADTCANLGNILKDMGRLDGALAAYRQALALNPRSAEAHSNLVLALHYHPRYDAKAIAAEQRCWNQQHAVPLRTCRAPHANDRHPERRLRIGYVSHDFRAHAVGRNIWPLFRQHDRAQCHITCYALVPRPDAWTARFRAQADGWRDMAGLSAAQVACQIRADEIDILVNLTLHTSTPCLLVFAYKAAPVQVTFAGYPGSTGLTTIDYRLSDPYLDPPGMDEAIYSEQTLRLPESFWCYDPVDEHDISVGGLPAGKSGVVTFGCLNNFCKINEDVLALWAAVLRQVAGARLLLLTRPGAQRLTTAEFMVRQGVAAERLEFVDPRPRRDYLELYHRIDVGLDSFPYNGHTTSLDSFWMGVPVVTLVGPTAVSRAGWCQLSNLGLPELAGQTPEEFVRIAVALARDLPRLAELRSTLRHRMERSPLMDAPRFARNIEAAYRQMWRVWCALEPQGP